MQVSSTACHNSGIPNAEESSWPIRSCRRVCITDILKLPCEVWGQSVRARKVKMFAKSSPRNFNSQIALKLQCVRIYVKNLCAGALL
jgi:hypothetical protein